MQRTKIVFFSITLFHLFYVNGTVQEENTNRHKREKKTELDDSNSSLRCYENYTLTHATNISFNLRRSHCVYYMIGSNEDKKCIAELICTELHFEPGDCKSKFFELSDGHNGELKTCRSDTFTTPYRASENGTNLIITYRGPIKEGVCNVSCAQLENNKKRFKTLLKIPDRKIEPSCVCGEINTQQLTGRVIGGDDAKPYEFPWLAALVFKDSREVFCGASLINDEYLLSAAHCFYDDITPDLFEIILHSHVMDLGLNDLYDENAKPGEKGSIFEVRGLNLKNFTDKDESSIRLTAKDVFLHPDYDDIAVDYDVAIIRLNKKIDLKNPLIRPVCLPSQRQTIEYSKRNAVVAGWGRPLHKAGAGNRILQKLDIPVFYNRKCQRLINELTPRMICGGHLEGGKDACIGDSGGPLVYLINENQYRQIGVALSC